MPWIVGGLAALAAGVLGWQLGTRSSSGTSERTVEPATRLSEAPLRERPTSGPTAARPTLDPPTPPSAAVTVRPPPAPGGTRDVIEVPGEPPAATEARQLVFDGRHEDAYRLLEERAAAAPAGEREALLLYQAQLLHVAGDAARAATVLDRIDTTEPKVAAQVRYLRHSLTR